MKEFNLDRAVQEYQDYIKPIRAAEQREKRPECRINEANYREMHRDQIASSTAKWKEDHPDYDKIWEKKNKAYRKKYWQDYYKEHKQEFKERYKKNKKK